MFIAGNIVKSQFTGLGDWQGGKDILAIHVPQTGSINGEIFDAPFLVFINHGDTISIISIITVNLI